MKLHELQPAPGSHHRRKRVGRGPGSGHGKTSTRGQKGQRARTSVNMPKTFEGGQTRLRSEEHTSELQSQSNLVCRLLLEKKKKKHYSSHIHTNTIIVYILRTTAPNTLSATS